MTAGAAARRAAAALQRRLAANRVQRWFDDRVVRKLGLSAFDRRTDNARTVRWFGHDIRQNPADAWTLQEIITDRQVDFVVECGTLRGGSAFYLASLLDLLGRGEVVSIDVAPEATVPHPRITYLTGSSTDAAIVDDVRGRIGSAGAREPLVILDSDHSADHVLAELRMWAGVVPVGGYIVVQDGVVDELRRFRRDRPGPLVAIERFLTEDDRFVVDEERSGKLLFHYSPKGCLRRVR